MYYSPVMNLNKDANNLVATSKKTFTDIMTDLSVVHFGRHKYKGLSKHCKPTMEQLQSFIQVRQPIVKYKGKSPVYISLKSKKKDELIDMCVANRLTVIQEQKFKQAPDPVLLCNDNSSAQI